MTPSGFKAFDQVKQMAERIKNMVLDILYYAKSRELKYQSVDVTEISQRINKTVKPMAEKNNIRSGGQYFAFLRQDGSRCKLGTGRYCELYLKMLWMPVLMTEQIRTPCDV